MKRILFVANVDSHITAFHLPYLRFFHESGWQVEVAANGGGAFPFADIKYDISVRRSPFAAGNLRAFFQLYHIFRRGHYDIVHFHTDAAHLIGLPALLLAGRRDTKILFTSHGHSYYRGAPLLRWMFLFPMDALLARFTDCVITMNRWDYALSRRFHKAKAVELVHGVGVRDIPPADLNAIVRLQNQFGVKDTFVLFYAAELRKHKNQELLIRAVSIAKKSIPQIRLLLAGKTFPYQRNCEKLVRKLHQEGQVLFLGQREDVSELLEIADCVIASSRSEGLPVNLLEAMLHGVPIVATRCRGHSDLVTHGVNGFLVGRNDFRAMAEYIIELYKHPELRRRFCERSLRYAEPYRIGNVYTEMIGIYRRYM